LCFCAPAIKPSISAKSNFFNYMRKGLWGLKAVPSDALVETASNVSPFGEILVPEELEKEIMRALPPLTIMRNLASVRTIASDRLRIRSMNEAVVGWNKLETTDAALAASLMTPAEEYQYAEDLYGLVKVGEDELQDADQNLQAIIADSFARAIAYAEDAAFIAGTGHAAGAQPTGIVNSACNAIAAKQAGAVTADDFLSLVYALPVQYRQSASFIVNSRTALALRMLKDGKGQYLWQPSVQQGRPNTFFGYPIYNQEAVADIPAAGTTAKVAVFGDIKSAYRIIDHTGMTMKRMDELYAEHGLIGFRVHKRVGGSVVRTDAARILQVPSA
jgi:HK97 family phage major capsid protein